MKEEGISENLEWKLIGCSKGSKVDATSCGIYLEDSHPVGGPSTPLASLPDNESPTISSQNRSEEV